MKKDRILIIDADEKQALAVCSLLKSHRYEPAYAGSFAEMERYLEKGGCRATIFNLDNIPASNQIFRELKRKNPGINIIALSGYQFHPELEEAFREYISVCLGVPVNPDELTYWLGSMD